MAWRDEHGELAQLDENEFVTEPWRIERITRARGAKKAARERWEGEALDDALAMLAAGKHVNGPINMLAGNTVNGLTWAADVRRGLTCTSFAGGHVVICEEEVRDVNDDTARTMLRHLLQQLGRVQRHKAHGRALLCARGRDAFWGKQHHNLPMTQAEIDMRHDEMLVDAEFAGRPAPPRYRVYRRYLPTRNANGQVQVGGQAMKLGKSVSTVCRYLRAWRMLGLLQSVQPHASKPDAVMPKRIGKFAYSETQVPKGRKLPEELMRRLVRWWNKLAGDRGGRPERRKAGEPSTMAQAHEPIARGPPGGRADAASPLDDLARDIGLSLTELDDLEQSIGF